MPYSTVLTNQISIANFVVRKCVQKLNSFLSTPTFSDELFNSSLTLAPFLFKSWEIKLKVRAAHLRNIRKKDL